MLIAMAWMRLPVSLAVQALRSSSVYSGWSKAFSRFQLTRRHGLSAPGDRVIWLVMGHTGDSLFQFSVALSARRGGVAVLSLWSLGSLVAFPTAVDRGVCCRLSGTSRLVGQHQAFS
jgi:hypothetical protein